MSNISEICDKELLMKMISKLVEDKDLKCLRKLINNNVTVQSFNPKELNIRFPIKGYRFTSRSKKLVLLKDNNYNKDNQKLLNLIKQIQNN